MFRTAPRRPRPGFAPALRLILCLFLLGLPAALLAQGDTRVPANPAAKTTPEAVIEPTLQEQLIGLTESIERKQKELSSLRAQRIREATPELDKEIEAAASQLRDLRDQFSGLATDDFQVSRYGEPPTLDVNWQEDLVQIIYPLLREMREFTEKPRTIERLKAEIAFYRQNAAGLATAVAHMEQVIADTADAKLLRSLRNLHTRLVEQRTDLEHKVAGLRHRLDELERDTVPLWSSIGEGAKTFLTTIGMHIGLGLLVAIAVYYLTQLVARLPMHFFSPQRVEQMVFVDRMVHFLGQLFGWLLALLAFVTVLYALDSWVMLGIAAIALLIMAFGLKDVIPNYLVEIRTLFNLGSIRQGERLIYNGLPWRIASLDVYTVLHNPALDGLQRVPLTQISRLSSRPFNRDEPWFPTARGDWVLLNDDAFGRVVVQTPEIVQLNFGESIINYRTEKFLDARPRNLSGGFTVVIDFSIDYRHQTEATTRILDNLRVEMQRLLMQSEFAPHCASFNVEFKSSGSSSLDFRILGTFRGEAADNYWRIQRWVQHCALDCANKFGWAIPFQQIVVHRAPDDTPPSPAAAAPVLPTNG